MSTEQVNRSDGQVEHKHSRDAEIISPTQGSGGLGSSRSIAAPRSNAGMTIRNPQGFLAQLRFSSLRSRRDLEAADVALSAEIELLRHRAEAASRESKAYWDAKSVEIATTIKSYVQARLRMLEIERFADKTSALEHAYELFWSKIETIQDKALPEDVKSQLIDSVHRSFSDLLNRLQDDTIAGRFDLKD